MRSGSQKRWASTFADIDITATAELMLEEMDHPFAAARRSTTSRSRTCRRVCAPTTCSASPTSAAASCSGTGDLSELALGWSTYGVGDQMSHYNVNGGVPKTLIQHLIRWVDLLAISSTTRSTRCCSRCSTPRSRRSWCPTGEDEEIQSSEAKVGPYVLQDFSLFQVLRYGFRPSKVAFLAWHAWSDAERGDWPPDIPSTSGRPTR